MKFAEYLNESRSNRLNEAAYKTVFLKYLKSKGIDINTKDSDPRQGSEFTVATVDGVSVCYFFFDVELSNTNAIRVWLVGPDSDPNPRTYKVKGKFKRGFEIKESDFDKKLKIRWGLVGDYDDDNKGINDILKNKFGILAKKVDLVKEIEKELTSHTYGEFF